MHAVNSANDRKKGPGPFPAALLLNVCALILLLALFSPSFETNDDTLIATLVNGVKLVSDPHLVYQNILLGKFYIFLYGITSRIPWYTLLQTLVLFVSYTGISWVLIRRLGMKTGLFLSAFTVLFFGYESYCIIQYTRTAGIAAASAMFLLYDASDPGRHEEGAKNGPAWPAVAAGIVLGVIASWYRFAQFLPCALLTTGIGLYMLLEHFFIRKDASGIRKWTLRELFSYLAPFALMGVLALGTYAADRMAYRDGVWKDYMAFNDARTALYDYGFPSYKKNTGLYDELGIGEQTLKLYRGWDFADPERFTLETMNRLIDAKPKKTLGLWTVKAFLKEFPWKFIKERVFFFFLAVLLMYLAGGMFRKRELLCVLYQIGVFALLYFYLYFSGRYLRARVDTGLWFALSLGVLWFVTQKGARRAGWIIPAIMLVFLVWKRGSYHWRFLGEAERKKQLSRQEQMVSVSKDEDHLYIAKLGALAVFGSYAPYDPMPRGLQNNLIYLGGWGAYTNAWWETLKAWNAENPYRDLIDREDLLLVDDDIELTLEYLRTFYKEDAAALEVGSAGKYTIYRIVSEGAS